jgi:hypothetical protein
MVKFLTCVAPREHNINFQMGRLLKLSVLEMATAGLQLKKQYPLLWYWLIREISPEESIEDSVQYHGQNQRQED